MATAKSHPQAKRVRELQAELWDALQQMAEDAEGDERACKRRKKGCKHCEELSREYDLLLAENERLRGLSPIAAAGSPHTPPPSPPRTRRGRERGGGRARPERRGIKVNKGDDGEGEEEEEEEERGGDGVARLHKEDSFAVDWEEKHWDD